MKRSIRTAAVVLLLAAAFTVAQAPGWSKRVYTGQTTTVQTVKNTAGSLGGWAISNAANSASSCVQFFDTLSTVTLGSTAPSMVVEVGPNATNTVVAAAGSGIAFQNQIQFAVATTCTGSTAPSNGLNISVLFQ